MVGRLTLAGNRRPWPVDGYIASTMRLRAPKPATWTAVAIALMFVVSAYILLINSSDEPYFCMVPQDALVQVGLSSVLIVAWLQLVWVAFRVTRGVKFSALRVASIVFALAGIGILATCIDGYLSDIGAAESRYRAAYFAEPVDSAQP